MLVARTDAEAAKLLTSDFDERDKPFCTGERTEEGYFRIRAGLDLAIARAVAYAPYADVLWCETSKPDLEFARKFAEGVQRVYPDKLLAYNCSPSFNWKTEPGRRDHRRFQNELGAMGYRFQFVTLAGFPRAQLQHVGTGARLQGPANGSLHRATGKGIRRRSRTATARSNTRPLSARDTSMKSQASAAKPSTQALRDSTEEDQFQRPR